MTLPLTPERLQLAYEYLSACPPFDKWNMPDGDDIDFKVGRSRGEFGCYQQKAKHTVIISSHLIGRTAALLETMAHEMIHIHQDRTGMPLTHDLAFKRMAARVCTVHGFDPKPF